MTKTWECPVKQNYDNVKSYEDIPKVVKRMLLGHMPS